MVDLKQLMETKKKEVVGWTPEFVDNFRCKVKFITRAELRRLIERCTVITYDKKTHQRVDRPDEDRLYKQLSAYILDWEGLTPETLARILPVDVSDIEGDIPCTENNKITLLKEAYEFDDFIRESITSLDSFEEQKLEEELKNSEALSQQD